MFGLYACPFFRQSMYREYTFRRKKWASCTILENLQLLNRREVKLAGRGTGTHIVNVWVFCYDRVFAMKSIPLEWVKSACGR